MSEKSPTANISPSICEAALEEYNLADNSLAELIKKASIEVRDFMLLSFVCDQGRLCSEQISRAFGFEPDETQGAIERLIMAQLVELDGFVDSDETDPCIRPTDNGRKVCRRILDDASR
jgi:hypothetical protein